MSDVYCPAPLTILDRNYLQILNQQIPDDLAVSRAVRFCAAKLLQIFDRLTRWKQGFYNLAIEHCWLWIPIFKSKTPTAEQLKLWQEKAPFPRSLYEELQGEHCKDVIRSALELLTETLGLVERRTNPNNGQDRTYQYQANLGMIERLKSALGDIVDRSPSQVDQSISQVDRSVSQSDESATITEIRSTSFSQTTSTAAAVEKEDQTKQPEQPGEQGDRLGISAQHPPVTQQTQLTGEDICNSGGIERFFTELQELHIEQNQQVLDHMLRFRDRIEDALKYTRQEIKKGWVNKPTGLFVKALKEGRKPLSRTNSSVPGQLPKTEYWKYVTPARNLYQQGLTDLVNWLKGLWKRGNHELVEYLMRECSWRSEVTIGPEGPEPAEGGE